MEKSLFKRAIKGDYDNLEADQLPFIVNEFIYYICNNNIDIFRHVNPLAKKLTIPNF